MTCISSTLLLPCKRAASLSQHLYLQLNPCNGMYIQHTSVTLQETWIPFTTPLSTAQSMQWYLYPAHFCYPARELHPFHNTFIYSSIHAMACISSTLLLPCKRAASLSQHLYLQLNPCNGMYIQHTSVTLQESCIPFTTPLSTAQSMQSHVYPAHFCYPAIELHPFHNIFIYSSIHVMAYISSTLLLPCKRAASLS